MYVWKHSLINFRNYDSLYVELSPTINIFYGNNAQGKTNFLESIYLCATGRSQRTSLDRELIQFGQNQAHLQLLVKNESITDKIDFHLKRDDKKGVAINGVAIKKLGQLFGILLTVIFSPEDLQLIKAGPSERRRFIDMELCQLSNVYYYELQQYYRVLKQRNNLLKNIKAGKDEKDNLFVWDDQIVFHGCKIIHYREEFVEKINGIAGQIHGHITNDKEKLQVVYKPNTNEKDFADKLVRNYERDIFQGSTSTGIHKDDLSFFINQTDVRIYGSQGQQRTAALSTKLAEIEFIKEQKNIVPVLLLDDVMSELDESRQKFLLNRIDGLQSIITCTGVEDIIKKISHNANIYKVENGVITFEKVNFIV